MPMSFLELREHNYREVEDIYLTTEYPDHEPSDDVEPDLWSELPIRRGCMSFRPGDELDFEVSFVKPMAADKFENLFQLYFGVDGARTHLESYSAEKAKGYTDHQIAYTYGIYLNNAIRKVDSFVPLAEGDEFPRAFVERSSWKKSTMRFGINRYESFADVLYDVHTILALSREDVPRASKDLSSEKPHMSCVMSTAGIFGEQPLRSELQCITTLMMGRLRFHVWNKVHRYVPVFCYALNGRYVRVTQAYFDGQCLQLRQSEPAEFMPADGNMENVKMVLRWIMGEPTLDTKWDHTIEVSDGPTIDHLPRKPGYSSVRA